MRALNLDRPWDLEEYVEAMAKVHTCPYFFAFKLFERVSLCFCPYNYLLDPVFRETVGCEYDEAKGKGELALTLVIGTGGQ